MLADPRETIAASGRDAGALKRAADALAGTERFFKAQIDAVRLQAPAEANALRAQNRQMRGRIDHLLLDNDGIGVRWRDAERRADWQITIKRNEADRTGRSHHLTGNG